MINRIAGALDSPLITAGAGGPTHLRIHGPVKLHGSIAVRSSKNAAVALLCASLINHGRTVLRGIAQIEEVNRILEVLTSIGVKATWSPDKSELELVRPAAAQPGPHGRDRRPPHPFDHHVPRSRCCIPRMSSTCPTPGAATWGPARSRRTCRRCGTSDSPCAPRRASTTPRCFHPRQVDRRITLTERGDTVTENVLMAAAQFPGRTEIRNASSNYMVQDLCFFLAGARGHGRGHRHHHPDRPRAGAHRRGRRRSRPRRTRSRR